MLGLSDSSLVTNKNDEECKVHYGTNICHPEGSLKRTCVRLSPANTCRQKLTSHHLLKAILGSMLLGVRFWHLHCLQNVMQCIEKAWPNCRTLVHLPAFSESFSNLVCTSSLNPLRTRPHSRHISAMCIEDEVMKP